MNRQQYLFYPVLFLIIMFMVMFWRVALILLIAVLILLPSMLKDAKKCAEIKEKIDGLKLENGDSIIIHYNNKPKSHKTYISHDDLGIFVEYITIPYIEINYVEKTGYNRYKKNTIITKPIFNEVEPTVKIDVEV